MGKRLDEVLESELKNPEVRARWERTAVARAVALSVLRYRAGQRLTQKQLAERLGWKQAQMGRLELGEHTPTLDTLIHLSRALGLEFLVDIQLAQRSGARWVTSEAEQAEVTESFETADGGYVLVAAG
jgi:transcriptional regulator with XRE-family HTH domain